MKYFIRFKIRSMNSVYFFQYKKDAERLLHFAKTGQIVGSSVGDWLIQRPDFFEKMFKIKKLPEYNIIYKYKKGGIQFIRDKK